MYCIMLAYLHAIAQTPKAKVESGYEYETL